MKRKCEQDQDMMLSKTIKILIHSFHLPHLAVCNEAERQGPWALEILVKSVIEATEVPY